MRKAPPPGLMLVIMAKFLTLGDRCSSPILIISVVSQVIVEGYRDEVITCPIIPEEGKPIGEVFRNKLNVPLALKALDGKHVAIRKPVNSGSLYRNYKGFFPMVFMALVNGYRKFLRMDISAH
ncbi:uncharacterized protein [Diadema antillarum]|uniref:uncharacterized protein n=1 Tax=Diadema antillarum TaxID=105358 RepID=UPI003A868A80